MCYVFVVLEVGTRRIVHWNVTAHPTAEWTVQQFRVVPGDQTHRFAIHDRDTIYSEHVDRTLEARVWRCSRRRFAFRKRYIEHYHRERNHQGLDNRLIADTPTIDRTGRVRRRPRLGGLLDFYERVA